MNKARPFHVQDAMSCALRVLPWMCLICIVACGAVRQPREPRPGETTWTVLTYNLNYGMAGDPDTVRVLRELNAELVLLQETTEDWERALRAEFQAVYPHMSFRHCCGAGGLGILSKYPVEEREYVQAREAWFPAWRLIAKSPLGPIQVLNVHLRPQVSDSGSVIAGYFTTPPIREREMMEYHAYLDPELPTLVIGDFNEGESGRAVQFLRQRGLRSALPDFHGSAPTWRWHTSVGTVHAQLDHVVHDASLDPLKAEVIQRGRSDHYPVLVTFRRIGPAELERRSEIGCRSSVSAC